MNLNDPSGHDVDCGSMDSQCKKQVKAEQSCDEECQIIKRQNYLMSLVLKGSGPDGIWTLSDLNYFFRNRDLIMKDPTTWIHPDAAGVKGFAIHVGRLSSHYSNGDQEQFVRDFGLLFAGIPEDTGWLAAAISVAPGPQHGFLYEGLQGIAPEYVDSLSPASNQSHHYAGIFFLSYYTGETIATLENYLRDTPNNGDIYLGWKAATDATAFRNSGDYDAVIIGILGLTLPPP